MGNHQHTNRGLSDESGLESGFTGDAQRDNAAASASVGVAVRVPREEELNSRDFIIYAKKFRRFFSNCQRRVRFVFLVRFVEALYEAAAQIPKFFWREARVLEVVTPACTAAIGDHTTVSARKCVQLDSLLDLEFRGGLEAGGLLIRTRRAQTPSRPPVLPTLTSSLHNHGIA